ncbi:MAG: hypothetical protein LBI29_00360 [Rickettsiales bacterium]|jgi:hypothetical protein|nr:hypothetical protein [Rickettsiales bacterium]
MDSEEKLNCHKAADKVKKRLDYLDSQDLGKRFTFKDRDMNILRDAGKAEKKKRLNYLNSIPLDERFPFEDGDADILRDDAAKKAKKNISRPFNSKAKKFDSRNLPIHHKKPNWQSRYEERISGEKSSSFGGPK